MIQSLPIVTAEEMRRLEALAYKAGASEEDFMENAGAGMALAIEPYGQDRLLYVLIGKGNNGGDALVTARKLLLKGFNLICLTLYPQEECSPLCQLMWDRFEEAGGELQPFHENIGFDPSGILLDGLVGTGFKGAAEGKLAQAIAAANHSKLPIIALDIPSGLGATTGVVESVAIEATHTLSLGLPKTGFFEPKGWDHIGKLLIVDFGLSPLFIQQAKHHERLIIDESVPLLLPKIKRSRHKYERGYVIAIAGSPSMPGAALLACLAALHAGAGIVRLFHPQGMEIQLAASPYELIREGWDLKDTRRIHEEIKRAKAWILGPGIGRTDEAKQMMQTLLSEIQLPLILDADGLFFLAQHPEWKLPMPTLLTPHHEEMKRLLKGAQPTLANCQAYVEEKKITLVLKGAPTRIFHPGQMPLVIDRGDPGMATAGTGDVLTGILAALLAQGLTAYEAAVLGVWLHGVSGEYAAEDKSSYSLIASDLIDYLPEVLSDYSN